MNSARSWSASPSWKICWPTRRKILELIKTDLQEIAEKYGDERRTRIAAEASEDLQRGRPGGG